MDYLTFHDISQWQGNYNMADGSPLIAIKMGGGDDGLYFDSRAAGNYNAAAAAGKVIIGYWFYGGGDPTAEADKFIEAMSPLAQYDIMAIDVESGPAWNPASDGAAVAKIQAMAARIHDRTGMWPLVYMNTSLCTSKDWSPVLANCALWIADYRYTPDQDVPCGHPYLIHQYTSSPIDTDALFIPLDTLKKYGYHKPVQPSPAPPAPQPDPTPIPTPEPAPPPAPEPVPAPTTAPSDPQLDLEKENNSLLKQILALVKSLWGSLTSLHKKINKL